MASQDVIDGVGKDIRLGLGKEADVAEVDAEERSSGRAG
jgi:RIO-like serine/threonine protein kinase